MYFRLDGWRWRCRNKVSVNKQKATYCEVRVEFRTGTFFAKSKLSMFKMLGFVNLWVDNASLKLIMNQVEIAKQTAVDWASFSREVVFDAYLLHPAKLGGPGITVEIDESKFGKRKYHRGKRVEGQWIFGAYERGTGNVLMMAVEDR